MRKEKLALVTILLLAILTVGVWEVSTIHTDAQQDAAAGSAPQASQTKPRPVAIDLPLALHSAVKGKSYSYSGAISVPSPCDSVSSGISLQGANPSHVTINLSVTSEQCPVSTTTRAEFSVSLTSTSAKAPIVDAVTFDGMEIPYTLSDAK